MKTTPVALVGGMLILAGGLALAFYTGTKAPILQETKAKSIEKYISMSEKAISTSDLKNAQKYAKRALAIDPTNKKALAEFKKVILASCPKSTPMATKTNSTPTKASTPKTTATPAKPADDSEEEMGCI